MAPTPNKLGLVRGFVAFCGELVIALLLWVFGERKPAARVPWLVGPIGGAYIGESVYEEFAKYTGLSIERHARAGGLLPKFTVLTRPGFDAHAVAVAIRHFYENTTAYRMHMSAKAYLPMSFGLWLMVTTLSRKVNQLNFPLRDIGREREVESEIILLRDSHDEVRWTGWYRAERAHTLYAGFYTWTTLDDGEPAIKVVFPMPRGNATVLLRPFAQADGSLVLRSWDTQPSALGFYRIEARDPNGDVLRVWKVHALREEFRLEREDDGTIRATHRTLFFGLPVLDQYFRITPREA